MINQRNIIYGVLLSGTSLLAACGIPKSFTRTPQYHMPAAFDQSTDTVTIASLSWRSYFDDPYLIALIDTALAHNQELNIITQQINIAQNEVRARKGEYLPSVGLRVGAGMDKVSKYTNIGAVEEQLEIEPGKKMPEPLGDFIVAAQASWEVDIWHKLRNMKKAAVAEYLATVEAKNFMTTQLISEIAEAYYELLALDQQLLVLKKNIEIQTHALDIVKVQKQAARITELPVKKFEAEVLKTKSAQFQIQQKVVEAENKINFLLGRYPQTVARVSRDLNTLAPQNLQAGLPSQLLSNRPDVRRLEYELEAANLNVKAAKARFYPSLGISASVGFNAFNPTYLVKTPGALLYSLAGDLIAPLVNKNAIKASYLTANAKQVQLVYEYEQKLLNAYVEVANNLKKLENLKSSLSLQEQQVAAMNASVTIVNDLFMSTRADYMEVLMTQRDALESQFDLIETQQHLLTNYVMLYRALGGGWR